MLVISLLLVAGAIQVSSLIVPSRIETRKKMHAILSKVSKFDRYNLQKSKKSTEGDHHLICSQYSNIMHSLSDQRRNNVVLKHFYSSLKENIACFLAPLTISDRDYLIRSNVSYNFVEPLLITHKFDPSVPAGLFSMYSSPKTDLEDDIDSSDFR